MKFIKLIAPAMLLTGLALFPSHADAQTMGEYATTTAGVSSGGDSMGTDLAPSSSTWGASRLGASFQERAGAASQSASGDFDARAGSLTGGSASESRWPGTELSSSTAPTDRFADSSGGSADRFATSENRFDSHSEFKSSADRFPKSAFSDNSAGLDTNNNTSGLDTHYNVANQ
jgi:hypothetical protein